MNTKFPALDKDRDAWCAVSDHVALGWAVPAPQVLASYGHVRDLPAKTGSVLPEADFDMKWSASPRAVKPMLELRAALKGANSLLLATDPDRCATRTMHEVQRSSRQGEGCGMGHRQGRGLS